MSELMTFESFFTSECIEILVANTNSYAQQAREFLSSDLQAARPWEPTNTLEIRRFIGTLIYLGLHPTSRREDHWGIYGRLSTVMSI